MCQVREAECVARMMHEAMDDLMPAFGYQERKEPWDHIPERNRNLMIAAVQRLINEDLISVRAPQGASA